MKDDKLEIGDIVYIDTRRPFPTSDGKLLKIKISKVVRLTKTMAVLENGYRLTNTMLNSERDKCFFKQQLYRYNYWKLLTKEILAKHEDQIKIQTINDWFKNKNFTDEELQGIYLCGAM